MANAKPKVIVICGPTASGKSDVAIKLAKEFDGEIISTDSRQIFRGMNIGSGKVPGAFDANNGFFISEKIPHYLIDVAEPNEDFNISHFKKIAEDAIEKILAKGKLPIICGGTGFWIQAITENTNLPEVKPNIELRNMLRNKSAEELFLQLKELDAKRAENIDAKNKVRIIRAIEIASALGKVPEQKTAENNKYDFLQIGIKVQREVLNEKIKRRLGTRFNEGMIEEIENLHANGVSWERLETFGLEYRWIARYLQEKISLDEMKEKLYFDIIHYAKRQMTWFQKTKKILWLENYDQIKKEVNNFLDK